MMVSLLVYVHDCEVTLRRTQVRTSFVSSDDRFISFLQLRQLSSIMSGVRNMPSINMETAMVVSRELEQQF